ncbi:MAG: T9SS type A sorting domain-containing protein [Melioribacteraceae bacterium]|nr:T9SS type A sorting domain-containing protein [Melioribacteraceae bacterium]
MDIKIIIFFLFFPIISVAQSHSIIIDGNPSDWIGTPSSTVHGTTYSSSEWIYTGEINDTRTDTSPFWIDGEDITEVRFATDGTDFFGMIKVKSLNPIDLPVYSIALNNGTGNMNYIGDESQTIFGYNKQRSSTNIDIHFIQIGGMDDLCIELFSGDGWYFPSNNAKVSYNLSYNCVEFSIPLNELGITSTSNIVITLASFFRNDYYLLAASNNDKDNTVDFPGSDAVDVMTPGASQGDLTVREEYHTYGLIQSFAEIDISQAPLPVELTSFSGVFANNSILLNWETATEVNNYGFEIQRISLIGEWEKIGFIQGHGNSAAPNQYSFIDKTASFGEYSYRLNQIDLDGTSELYEAITIKARDLPSTILLNQNYPNPFNPTTQINFAVKEKCNAKLIVYDVLGNEISTLFNGEVNPNTIYKAEFDGSNLCTGIYFYKLVASSSIESKKMLLIK